MSEGTALVIGGSGGLGEAICRALARDGNNVVLSYRSKREAAEKVVREIEQLGRGAEAMAVDLLQPAQLQAIVARAIERFGHIHSVVYASGPKIEFQFINEITPETWAEAINIDVNGCFNLIWAVLPHLRQRRSGSIVALVTAAVDRAPPRDILSAAPKAAIQMLIRGIAREEGRYGIRANCVGPGYIEAGLGLATINAETEDFVARMVKSIPLRRAGQADDIADVVAFLVSDKARYVTGDTIAVAGGMQLA